MYQNVGYYQTHLSGRVHVNLCLEELDYILQRMKRIIYLFILTCASWIPCLKTSGIELGWDLTLSIQFSWLWEHLLDIHLDIQ